MHVYCLKQAFNLVLVLSSVIFVSAHFRSVGDQLKARCLQLSGYSATCVASSLASCKLDNKTEDICEWQSNLLSSLENISNNTIGIKESFQNVLKGESAIPVKSVERKLNCADLRDNGDVISGIRTIYPYKCCPNYPVAVYCDQDTDGGGWTVIQRRQNLPIREDFYRAWTEYVMGFGNLIGEFWLGLNNIHELTNNVLMELRFDLEDYEHKKRYAKYGAFRIEDASRNYIIHAGRFEGNVGDSLKFHNKQPFSTFDNDNDIARNVHCAEKYKGGFWYGKKGERGCHQVNINGLPLVGQHSSFADGINWYGWHGRYYSLKGTKMMIRPAF